MKFPHTVTVLRPTGTDAYGNPSASWASPSETTADAFVIEKGNTSTPQTRTVLALFPPDTDVRPTDRIRHDGAVYEVAGDVVTASSPSRAVVRTATLREVLVG